MNLFSGKEKIRMFYDISVVITRHLQVAGAVFLSIFFFFKKVDTRIRSIQSGLKEGDLWGGSQGVTKTLFKPSYSQNSSSVPAKGERMSSLSQI